MEKENLYKRVDLFFLIDSITQCSCNQKGNFVFVFAFVFVYACVLIFSTVGNSAGGTGDVFPSVIQAVLPRLLYAAAPPGNSAWENRRQCLKASAFYNLVE